MLPEIFQKGKDALKRAESIPDEPRFTRFKRKDDQERNPEASEETRVEFFALIKELRAIFKAKQKVETTKTPKTRHSE